MKIPFKDWQSKEISITAVCTLFPWKPHLFIRVCKTIMEISLHTDTGHGKRPQENSRIRSSSPKLLQTLKRTYFLVKQLLSVVDITLWWEEGESSMFK